MKNHTRIWLIILVTVVLLLALTVPGLAKKEEFDCFAMVNTVDKRGNFHTFYIVGVLDAYWEDGILYNKCTSTMEFGVQLNPGIRFATFDEICDKWADYCDSNAGTVFLTPDANPEITAQVRDLDTNRLYFATDWEYYIYDQEKDNIFILKEYNPPE